MKLYAERTFRIDTENAFKVGPHIDRVEEEIGAVVKLNLGEPDFPVPTHIKDEIKRQLDLDNTHYCDPKGLITLRRAIAKQVGETRGLKVSAERVVVFPGGKPSIGLVQQVYCSPGNEVIYPSPGFPIYESMIEFVGGVPVPMQLHESSAFNVDIDEIEARITDRTKLMIVNSPNNPCGSVIPKEDLQRLANLAKEHDIAVLSDEIYNRFLYEGEHHSIAAFPGMRDRTIILDGLSKSYAMTGWRIGYGVMPQELVEPISRLATNSVSCTASFTQIAALEALSGPQERSYSMVEEFKKRRDIIVAGLNDIPGIRCPLPLGAFYVFPSIEETEITSQVFAESLLSEAGVASLAGESFGRFGNGYIRFSFANSVGNLEIALERIRNFVRSR